MKKLKALFAVVFIIVIMAPAFAVPDMSAEVPMSSWEYIAFVQLASRGVITGQPEGFGTQPITRGDAASILVSTLSPGDILTKVNGEEVNMLEKLVDEYKEELLALSIVVLGLDNISIVQP